MRRNLLKTKTTINGPLALSRYSWPHSRKGHCSSLEPGNFRVHSLHHLPYLHVDATGTESSTSTRRKSALAWVATWPARNNSKPLFTARGQAKCLLSNLHHLCVAGPHTKGRALHLATKKLSGFLGRHEEPCLSRSAHHDQSP